ncbi:MAG: hypothetical protein Q9216_006553, partial [Gyalolechia sp. 2 TL-2023]
MPAQGTTIPTRPRPGSRTFVINGPTYSDGDASHRPDKPNYTRFDTDMYLQKIATKWMEEEAGGAEAGKTYTLGGLPQGYELWGRPRPLNPKHTDKWLYGHPSKKLFDSPYQFYPHWKFLLNYGSGESCQCPVDEEGTPDVYSQLFTLLRNEKTLKRRIEERASLDWRAEKPLVDNFVRSTPQQASFLPRQGEVVLYLRPLSSPLELRQEPDSHHIRVFDPRTNSYNDAPPQWLAGIVTQVPISPPTVSSLHPSSPSSTPMPNVGPSEASLNTSGYRISPLPSVNSTNKLLSKQQTYTPLHLIRPFSLQSHILAGIPPTLFHESITNALTASATVSLIDRHSFSGTWPHASVHSRGIFIGPEAYWLGDTVLLLPEDPSSGEPVTEIMHLSDIITTFHSLQASNDDNGVVVVTGNDCKRISIELHGEVYTTDPVRRAVHKPPVPVQQHPTPPRMRAYGNWFHLDQPGDVWAAPFPRVLSRLYEKSALAAWLPHTSSLSSSSSSSSSSSTLLDLSRESVLSARRLAAQTDERILGSAGRIDVDGDDDRDSQQQRRQRRRRKDWFWAEYRAEALDLRSLAGKE